MSVLWTVLKTNSILRMKVIWVHVLSVCSGSIWACFMKLLDGISEKTMLTRDLCVSSRREEAFPSIYYASDAAPGASHRGTAFKFPDMSQESHSHPHLQMTNQRLSKIQTLVSLQHASFFPSTSPDPCYCFNEY